MPEQPAQPEGKGRATPTRRDAEAARKQRLGGMPADPRARRAAEREARSSMYAKQREALKAGDEKNYPAQHRGEVPTFVRDYVDGRPRLAEAIAPVIVLSYVTLFLGRGSSALSDVSLAAEAVVALGVLDLIWLTFRLRTTVRKKFGDQAVRGVAFYAAGRVILPRPMRQPKPKVTITGRPRQPRR